MGSKEEWDEIEKSVENANRKRIQDYKGIDPLKKVTEINSKVALKNKIIFKLLKTILKILIILFVLWILFKIYTLLNIVFSNMRSSYYIDVEEAIETSIHADINLTSKEVDEKENGKYYFEFKKVPEIKFVSIRKFGNERNDCIANYQMYLFDKWNSKEKEEFIVEKHIDDDGLLYYSNYIKAENFIELQQATEHIINFLEYTESWNNKNKVFKDWRKKENEFIIQLENLYIETLGERIIPYSGLYQNEYEIREKAIKKYIELMQLKGRNIIDVPEEILKKYE